MVSPPERRYVLMIQPSGNSGPADPEAISEADVFLSPVAKLKAEARFCFFAVVSMGDLSEEEDVVMSVAGRFFLAEAGCVGNGASL
mmetsp:Transcript_22103/g.48073  ORF Transcript_22103/g.48073 Transcript_22103/m.48073 type:complete len:86 (-) Transcript_22103:3626-3883(-)